MTFPLNLSARGSARLYDETVNAALPAQLDHLLDRLDYAMSGAKWYTSRMKLDEALYREMAKELGGIYTPEDGLDELAEEEVPDQARARALTLLMRGGPDALRPHIRALRGRPPRPAWDLEKEVRRRKRNDVLSLALGGPIFLGLLAVPGFIAGFFFDWFPTVGEMVWAMGGIYLLVMVLEVYDAYISKEGRRRWDELVAMEYDISETKILDDQECAYLRTKGLV